MIELPSHSHTPVSLKEFVAALLVGGEVRVRPLDEPGPKFDEGAAEAVRAYYDSAGGELSGEAPELDLAAAGWAAEQFYRACQFLVCRDAPAEIVAGVLGEPCPARRGAAADFSVDLIFRFLPDLHDRARRMAPGDPLVAALVGWAGEWPLSSAGVVLGKIPALGSFADCPALWRLYVDRVTARRAEDRWRDPCVAAQLRADLGALPELAPALAESLRRAASALSLPSPDPTPLPA